ncbi:hypothetical protein A2160_00820 [Candidatus Beckwithbacteria bacterium RBG_13_42_9]|uniref:alanine--tRNA ligase n=1 Tax=Candidatus Beckwithbacteria bacterium RBG_13_42_9 TaxID=1797457 RepID=A0A1F5E389_9BACT|nr:MAG: hypothetical protein A2160_00820 [Candidatus Beckwithbacteria bacterium RBG_13_42_9]
MNSSEICQKYLDFFKSKGHAVIPPAPLVPPDDPTTLFTSAGMQQLVPYFKGQPHPLGKRLVDAQPSVRLQDLDAVADNRHLSMFVMLGNWSLGDYFKAEQLPWIWEFYTQVLKLNPARLYVTVYKGSPAAPRDDEAAAIWRSLGLPEDKIFFYEDNWWSRAGGPEKMPAGEIGGPDSEVFFEFTQIEHDKKFGEKCHPNCDCGRFLEIGNSVFLQYEKQKDGSFKPLPNKNVDFGGGLERITAAVNDEPDVFLTDIFKPMITHLEKVTGKPYSGNNCPPMRIIADHLRAASAMIKEGLEPSNKQQGYVLRRLIRRSAVKMRQLKGTLDPRDFPEEFQEEVNRFKVSLERGLREFNKLAPNQMGVLSAFNLFQSYGFPFEVIVELFQQRGHSLDRQEFDRIFAEHQKLSRTASAGMFKGGLADHSEIITKYHTATHLLQAALRQVLGDHVQQVGSNNTGERLRFDFAHPQALTAEEIKKVEDLINQKIKEDLPVVKTIEDKDRALASGALAFFQGKYPDKVTVYTVGRDSQKDWFSKELCGGPHVASTGEIGGVRIKKEEAVGTGKRRIYVVLK